MTGAEHHPAAKTAILVVDIGGTHIKCGYSVGEGPHSYRRLVSTQDIRNSRPVASLANIITSVERDSGLRATTVVVTVPGFLDADGDRVISVAYIPELNSIALATDLQALLGRPVLLERDSILALAGEIAFGTAKASDAVLGVFFGTGIGAAFIDKGMPLRGAGWALELGHIPIRGEGRQAPDLNTDCLELYASGKVLQEIADRYSVPIGSVFSAADGLPGLAKELDAFVRDQAYAVSAATALLSPHTIVIGGGIISMDHYPKARLWSQIRSSGPFVMTGQALDLKWSSLGWESTLYGAASTIRRHASLKALPVGQMQGE